MTRSWLAVVAVSALAVLAAVPVGPATGADVPSGAPSTGLGPASDAATFGVGSVCNVRGVLNPVGCQAWETTWQPGDKGRQNHVNGRTKIPGTTHIALGGYLNRDSFSDVPGGPALGVVDAADGSWVWRRIFDAPIDLNGVGASEDLVFLAGELDHEINGSLSEDGAVYAFDAETGDRVWRSLYTSGDQHEEDIDGVTAARDGEIVVGTGIDFEGANDVLTVGYNASTGEILWSDTYDGPRGGSEYPCVWCLEVSPDGHTAYVGIGPGESTGPVVVAYNVTTGERVFVASPEDPGTFKEADAMDLSPDGSTVVIAGDEGPTSSSTMTAAFDARTGEQKWQRTWASNSFVKAVQIDPVWGQAIVAGVDLSPGEGSFVLSYDIETGERLWRSDSPLRVRDGGVVDLDLGPSGDTVILATESGGVPEGSDMILTGIALEDGMPVWSVRYDADSGFSLHLLAGVQMFDGLGTAVVGGVQDTSSDRAWVLAGFQVPPEPRDALPG